MFRTNLAVQHGMMYCIKQYNCTDCTKLCNTAHYAVLLMMNG